MQPIKYTFYHSQTKSWDALATAKISKMMRKKMEAEAKTAGDKWFGMRAPEMTDKIKRDLHILANRGAIDPKRFYKTDKMTKKKMETPTYFEMGTVVHGREEFYSSRLTNKERKTSMAAELMGDSRFKKYAKRKFMEVQDRTQSGGKKSYKKRKSMVKKSWQRS